MSAKRWAARADRAWEVTVDLVNEYLIRAPSRTEARRRVRVYLLTLPAWERPRSLRITRARRAEFYDERFQDDGSPELLERVEQAYVARREKEWQALDERITEVLARSRAWESDGLC